MLTDLLNGNNTNIPVNNEDAVVLEAINTFSTMLGEDPAVALEAEGGKDTLLTKVKEKTAAIAAKVKAFVAKVIAWIKDKLFAFFKKGTVEINKDVYTHATKVLAALDKAEVGKVTGLLYKLISKMEESNLTGLKDALAKNEETIDSAMKVFNDFSSSSTETVSVKTATFEKQKAKFQEELDSLQKVIKELEDKQVNFIQSEGNLGPVVLQMSASITNMNIKVLNARISVLNKLIAAATDAKKE